VCARPIDKRERELERKGPVWRAPLVIDVLRNLPFLRHVPARAVEVRARPAVDLHSPAMLLCTAGGSLSDAAAPLMSFVRSESPMTCVMHAPLVSIAIRGTSVSSWVLKLFLTLTLTLFLHKRDGRPCGVARRYSTGTAACACTASARPCG
jgi:hypothetical protein